MIHNTDLLTIFEANVRYRLNQQEVSGLTAKIIKEIIIKTKYTKEISENNSHSQFLSACFNTHVRAFLRPRYRVDRLVGIHDLPDVETIRRRIYGLGV